MRVISDCRESTPIQVPINSPTKSSRTCGVSTLLNQPPTKKEGTQLSISKKNTANREKLCPTTSQPD